MKKLGSADGAVGCELWSTGYFLPGSGELPAAVVRSLRGEEAGALNAILLDALRQSVEFGAALIAAKPANAAQTECLRALGFAEFFTVERTPINALPELISEEKIVELSAGDAPSCGAMRFEVLRWRGHMTRSDELWRAAAEREIERSGALIAVEREGALAGYALCRPTEKGEAVIDELFCEDEAAYVALRRAAMERCGASRATMTAPACPHGAERYGLIRAIDCERLIREGLSRRPGEFSIEVADDELGASARYTARDGAVSVEGRRGALALTPGELAATVLGGGPNPYMNLVD